MEFTSSNTFQNKRNRPGRPRLNQGEQTTLYVEKTIKALVSGLPGDTISHKLQRLLEEHAEYKKRFGEIQGMTK